MMKMKGASRREFVIGGLATTAAIGLAGCDGAAGPGQVVTPAATLAPPLTKGEADRWEGLLGDSFVITGESGKIIAKLTAVERIPADPGRPSDLARSVPFFVHFESDARLAPEGGKTYQISHSSTGVFDLFLGHAAERGGKGLFLALLN